MIVVTDTSPMNYLIRLGQAEILPSLFQVVLAPLAVRTELSAALKHPEVTSWALSPPHWIQWMEIEGQDIRFPKVLGAGEREAIRLAIARKVDVLLIDDLAGRREAKRQQLPVRGTLAVLLEASLRGLLDFPTEYKRLLDMGFRSSRAVEASLFEYFRKERVR